MLDFNRNHFELFGLSPAFTLKRESLEHAYRDIQAEIHPDRFAHAGEAEQRLAMQWTARVNEAYQTLRQPFERARYLLELNGVDAMDARNTAMPADFLAQQIELRERLDEARAAKDLTALERMEADARAQAGRLERQLAQLLDERHAYTEAAEVLRMYRFMDKLLQDIEQASEEIDAP
ncbi:MAG: Fe-S protein assembly co-chaperone HscB [Thiobacillaceae bacterium]